MYVQVRHWAGLVQSHPKTVTFPSLALNLIGPRAVDVLSELSYAPITPEHFPSLFCKVSDCASFLLPHPARFFKVCGEEGEELHFG